MSQFTQGCRVKDKMKIPRPGDDIVQGTVTQLTDEEFTVLMDDGRIVSGKRKALEAIYEVISSK